MSNPIVEANMNRLYLTETEIAAITQPSQLEGRLLTGKQAKEVLARIGHKLYKFSKKTQPTDENRIKAIYPLNFLTETTF